MDAITSNHPDAQKFAEQVQRLLTLANQLPATTPLPGRMKWRRHWGTFPHQNTATAIRAQKKKERRQRKRAKTEGEREKEQAQAQSAQVKKEKLNVQQERRTTQKLAGSPPPAIATSLPDNRPAESEPATPNSPIDISSEPGKVDDDRESSTKPRPVLPDGDIAFYCCAEGLQEICEDLEYCFGLEYLWLKTDVHSLHAKLQSMSKEDFVDSNNPYAFNKEQRRLTNNFTNWRPSFREEDLETASAQALKSTWIEFGNWSHEVTLSRQRPQEGQPHGLEVKLRTSVWSGNFKYGTWWITSMRAIDDVVESICHFIGVDHDVGDRMASEMRDPEAW
ncbi:hypothetical protein PENSPDRAFT_753448 [Peniophora sp. CONT]|nr:hypothetical protein PENSPDRAFT_753448 [Peniophora sp. CONT]